MSQMKPNFDLSRLFIVSDFDKTLTKAYVNGKLASTGIAIYRNGGYISEAYVTASKELFAKYHPYEIDSALSVEQKLILMDEWWSKHLELFVAHGLTRDIIQKAATDGQILLKDDATEFFTFCADKKIPLLIFSAAHAPVIEAHLKSRGLLFPNIHIHSNTFVFDKNGRTTGYGSDVITSINKSLRTPLSSKFRKEVVGRDELLLLGDTLDDLGMAVHFDVKKKCTIAFLNKEMDSQKEEFVKNYDLVLETDSLVPVVNLLSQNN